MVAGSGPWNVLIPPRAFVAVLNDYERITPAWVFVVFVSLMKLAVVGVVLGAIDLSQVQQMWCLFVLSFLAERPLLVTEAQVPQIGDTMLYSERRQADISYYGRMLLFTIISVGLLWLVGLAGLVTAWYQVLALFTVASFIKYLINMNRWRLPRATALWWASRCTLGVTLHVMWSCYIISRLAQPGVSSRAVHIIESVFLGSLRHFIRYATLSVLLGTVRKHPYTMRRYLASAVDVAYYAGLFSIGDTVVVFTVCHVVLVVDCVVTALMPRSHIKVFSPVATMWSAILGIVIVIPADMHFAGVVIVMQRVLIAVYLGGVALILHGLLGYFAEERLQRGVWCPGVVDVGRSLSERLLLDVYDAMPYDDNMSWLMQTMSTAFAIVATLVSLGRAVD